MKVPCMVVVYLLTAVASAAAQPARVRLLDGIAAVAYEQGVHHSAAFRAIVTALGFVVLRDRLGLRSPSARFLMLAVGLATGALLGFVLSRLSVT